MDEVGFAALGALVNPARRQQVTDAFHGALELDGAARPGFIAEICGPDQQLRREVESLLAAHDKAGGFMGVPAAGLRIFDDSTGTGDLVGEKIGPYQLVRELGAGGMGQVWLAEQTEPVRRQVAIKLIRAGFYNQHVLKRFLAERQSLALMNHPAIATIFEAGATAHGQPYLAMEYVDGCPITEYCNRHALPIAKRLKLFLQVCDGVQHAHQKAIIHRDLKPSNILVTEIGEPMPHIIDFGVAKGLALPVGEQTMLTEVGMLIGTAGYMSPEQSGLNSKDVDTRSDVYSLGVIFYELLVGALPFDPPEDRSYKALHRAAQAEARKPSIKIRLAAEQATEVARARGTEVAPLLRQLCGDLDSIALKALEIDPQRRYATPLEFAADIERYLRNEPVSAHPPGVAYRARKYLRRHWAGAAVASAALAVLLIFFANQSTQLHKIRLERDRADQVIGFMTQIFKVAEPSESRGNTVTAREILDQSSREIETGVGLDANVRSDLLQVMADTYTNLGLYARAHSLAQAALDRRHRLLGSEDPKTLESLQQMGNILLQEGHVTEAEDSLRHTVSLELRILGPKNLLTLQAQNLLVYILQTKGRYAEGEKLGRQLLTTETEMLGARNALTLKTTARLASALGSENRFAEAEPLYRQTLSIQREVLGTDHPDTLKTESSLAYMLRQQGRYPEAEVIFRDVLAVRRRVLGEEHPETADTLTTLAIVLVHDRSRYKEAEELYRSALATELRQLGPESRFTTRAEEGLFNLLGEEERYAEAEPFIQEVLRVRLKLLGPDHTDTLLTQRNLACLLLAEGHLEAAEQLFRATLERDLRVLAPDDRDVFGVQYMLAETLLQAHRPQEAEVLARQAFDGQLRALGPQHPSTFEGLNRLGRSLAALGRYDEAAALYMSTIDQIASQPKSDPSKAWYAYAVMAAQSGRADDAFRHLEHAAALGYKNVESLRNDGDLKPLRKDERFARLIERVQSAANSTSGQASIR